MVHDDNLGALDNDAIVQYTVPYQFKQPQDILPLDDTPFLMLVCTTKSRLDATLSALLDYSHQNNYPETYEHNVDIINALANVFFINELDCGNMDLCELIEQCLTSAANGTNQSLSDVINQIIQNYSSSKINVNDDNVWNIRYENGSTPISNVSLDDGLGGCDLDILWGVCFEVATRIAKMGLDILETYTASADKIQKIAAISGAIPFVGNIANSLLSTAADIAQDIENAYVAYETPSIIEDVACDLFCMVQSECRFPTYDELLNYYATGGNTSLIEILSLSYSQLYGQIFNTIAGNPIVWYGVQTFALATLYLDGEVLGNEGTKVIDQWSLIGSGNPSNNHIALCDCPTGTLCYEWDFTIDAQGWTVWSTGGRPFGVYVAGVGWQCTYDNVSGAGLDNRIYIENLSWAQQTAITRIECDVIPTAGGGARSDDARVQSGTSSIENHDLTPQTVINSTLQTVAAEFSSTGDGIRVLFVTNTGASDDQDAITIQKIRVYYTSGQPEDGQAC